MTKWQLLGKPSSTLEAPWDGNPVWLCTKEHTDPAGEWHEEVHHPARCSIGRWNPEGDSWVNEQGQLDAEDVCMLAVTGFWESGGGWFQPNEVTHWMPLPEPPQ